MISATDKQLVGIKLTDVLEKRRLGQALNLKEFAVLAGVSYSVAREWAQITGFPRFEGVIFWHDFEEWRKNQYQKKKAVPASSHEEFIETNHSFAQVGAGLPARAAQILLDSVNATRKREITMGQQ